MDMDERITHELCATRCEITDLDLKPRNPSKETLIRTTQELSVV